MPATPGIDLSCECSENSWELMGARQVIALCNHCSTQRQYFRRDDSKLNCHCGENNWELTVVPNSPLIIAQCNQCDAQRHLLGKSTRTS
jgi:hypothetical protein